MPPRRKAVKKAASTIDLALDSDSDAPPPAKKAVRASTRKGRSATVVIEDDDDGDADRALAKQLQDEENKRGDDDEAVMQVSARVRSGSLCWTVECCLGWMGALGSCWRAFQG